MLDEFSKRVIRAFEMAISYVNTTVAGQIYVCLIVLSIVLAVFRKRSGHHKQWYLWSAWAVAAITVAILVKNLRDVFR